MTTRNYVDELGETPGGAKLTADTSAELPTPEVKEPAIPVTIKGRAGDEVRDAQAEDAAEVRRGAIVRRRILRTQMWFFLLVVAGGLTFTIASTNGHLFGPIAAVLASAFALDRGKRLSSLKVYVRN